MSGKFCVLFLSHIAPGFQLWFYLHLCMWVIHRGLLLRLPWRTWVCPSQNQWFLGQQEIWCSRRTWQPTPLLFPGGSLGQRSPQAIIHRVPKSCTWAKQLHTYSCRTFFFFFSFPLATLSQWGSCMEVAWLLGSRGPWQYQPYMSSNSYCHRRYGDVEDMVTQKIWW